MKNTIKKIAAFYVILILFQLNANAQTSAGIYTGINTTFPDNHKTGNLDSAGIGANIGSYMAFRKNALELSFRAAFILRSSHMNFYYGGLGAGTTYNVDLRTFSFQPGLFPAIYFGQTSHFYLNAGIGLNFTFNRHLTGDYLSHDLLDVSSGEVDQRDTIFFKDINPEYLLGFGCNNIKLGNETAFIEVSASRPFKNEFDQSRGDYVYKPLVLNLTFGIKLF